MWNKYIYSEFWIHFYLHYRSDMSDAFFNFYLKKKNNTKAELIYLRYCTCMFTSNKQEIADTLHRVDPMCHALKSFAHSHSEQVNMTQSVWSVVYIQFLYILMYMYIYTNTHKFEYISYLLAIYESHYKFLHHHVNHVNNTEINL